MDRGLSATMGEESQLFIALEESVDHEINGYHEIRLRRFSSTATEFGGHGRTIPNANVSLC